MTQVAKKVSKIFVWQWNVGWSWQLLKGHLQWPLTYSALDLVNQRWPKNDPNFWYQCTYVALLWVKVIALCAPSVYKISGPKFRSCKIYQISCLTSDTSCAEKEANPHWSDLRQLTKSSPRVKLTGAGQWPILKDSFQLPHLFLHCTW